MLRVCCSRYMDDWDRHLPQVMRPYNSTEHSTTGISPHMKLTGHEQVLPLTFFYPEYEGKRTAPQAYVRDVIGRQQKLNDLCRRNTPQAHVTQKRRFDKRTADVKLTQLGTMPRCSRKSFLQRVPKAAEKMAWSISNN